MSKKRPSRSEAPLNWLPVDSRLIFPLLSFGHVRGAARIFLTIEMVLAAGVVLGTFVLLMFRLIV